MQSNVGNHGKPKILPKNIYMSVPAPQVDIWFQNHMDLFDNQKVLVWQLEGLGRHKDG